MEVWAVEVIDKAAETDFFPEKARNTFMRSSIQAGASVGVIAPFDGRIRIQKVKRETGFSAPSTNPQVEFIYRLG